MQWNQFYIKLQATLNPCDFKFGWIRYAFQRTQDTVLPNGPSPVCTQAPMTQAQNKEAPEHSMAVCQLLFSVINCSSQKNLLESFGELMIPTKRSPSWQRSNDGKHQAWQPEQKAEVSHLLINHDAERLYNLKAYPRIIIPAIMSCLLYLPKWSHQLGTKCSNVRA